MIHQENHSILYAPESLADATVAWDPPVFNGGRDIDGYFIERREKRVPQWRTCNARPCTDRRYHVIGLNRGVEYMFRARAMNDVGTGEPSESSKPALAVDPIEPPGEPLGFKVSDSNKSSISLSFKAPAYDGGTNIMGYIIEHTEALPPPPK